MYDHRRSRRFIGLTFREIRDTEIEEEKEKTFSKIEFDRHWLDFKRTSDCIKWLSQCDFNLKFNDLHTSIWVEAIWIKVDEKEAKRIFRQIKYIQRKIFLKFIYLFAILLVSSVTESLPSSFVACREEERIVRNRYIFYFNCWHISISYIQLYISLFILMAVSSPIWRWSYLYSDPT